MNKIKDGNNYIFKKQDKLLKQQNNKNKWH